MTKTTTTEKTATTTNNDESANPAKAGERTVLPPALPIPHGDLLLLSLSHTPNIPHIMTIASPVFDATTTSNTTNTTTTTTEKDGTEAGEGIITPPVINHRRIESGRSLSRRPQIRGGTVPLAPKL